MFRTFSGDFEGSRGSLLRCLGRSRGGVEGFRGSLFRCLGRSRDQKRVVFGSYLRCLGRSSKKGCFWAPLLVFSSWDAFWCFFGVLGGFGRF